MLRAQTVDGARVEWDFDGGRASDSLGYGGINVHWDSPGEKTVRIFVSHPDYSCTFDRATTTIVVKPAPELPEVRIVPTEQAQCGFSVLGLAPPPPGVKYVSDYGGAKVRLEDEWPEEFRYVVYPGDVPPPYRMTFRAVNDVGCESETATLIVDFDANIAETILRYRPPNVFTPNGDDVNPVYFLPGLQSGCAEYEMNIYDRWGMWVARINNAQPTWDGAVDGRPSPETVFVYVLKLKLFDGRETQKNGTITLLR
jgi:gliding motility-associated-like protein